MRNLSCTLCPASPADSNDDDELPEPCHCTATCEQPPASQQAAKGSWSAAVGVVGADINVPFGRARRTVRMERREARASEPKKIMVVRMQVRGDLHAEILTDRRPWEVLLDLEHLMNHRGRLVLHKGLHKRFGL